MGSGWASAPWGTSPWGSGSGSFLPIPPPAPDGGGPGTGWGFETWGFDPWVGGDDAVLLEAFPIRENVVGLLFGGELSFDGLSGLTDATDPKKYVFTPVPLTYGYDDALAARPVTALFAERALSPDGETLVAVTLDRHLTAYPAMYVVQIRNLLTPGGLLLTPENSSFSFDGVSAPPPQFEVDGALPARDFAHPDMFSAAVQAGDPVQDALGTLPVDSTGDYANDSGVVNLRKRVMRRLMSAKGRFLHLATYGVGVRGAIKKLATAAARQALCSEAESQISQEPDVQKVVVRLIQGSAPGLWRFVVLVKPIAGKPQRIDAPAVDFGSS